MRSIIGLSAVLAAAACAGQQAQELPPAVIPVRVGTSGVVAVLEPVEAAPPAGGRGGGAALGDPFARLDRMDWPGPNEYGGANGAPGPAYWQQRADYAIAVALDTARRPVGGRVTIRYTNNSPDTLRAVWLQLDQNLYRPRWSIRTYSELFFPLPLPARHVGGGPGDARGWRPVRIGAVKLGTGDLGLGTGDLLLRMAPRSWRCEPASPQPQVSRSFG